MLYTIILIILMVFAGVAGITVMIAGWIGAYEPYVDGPDPITLLTSALVIWLYIDRRLNKAE